MTGHPVAINIDTLLNGIAADPRCARAAAILPRIVTHFSIADADAPVATLRARQARAEQLRDWIIDGKPLEGA